MCNLFKGPSESVMDYIICSEKIVQNQYKWLSTTGNCHMDVKMAYLSTNIDRDIDIE